MAVIFSRACEYAIRGLVEMAKDKDKLNWKVPEVAERADSPAPFLAKTFQSLVKGGILISTKGRQGGFSFAKPSTEIFVIEVVNLIDGGRLTHDCALGLPDCHDDNPCPFHTQWRRVRAPLIEALSKETIEHLTNYPARKY